MSIAILQIVAIFVLWKSNKSLSRSIHKESKQSKVVFQMSSCFFQGWFICSIKIVHRCSTENKKNELVKKDSQIVVDIFIISSFSQVVVSVTSSDSQFRKVCVWIQTFGCGQQKTTTFSAIPYIFSNL